MLAYLIKGLGPGIYAGILPGPTQAFILSKTIRNGWKRSLVLSLVPLVSDLPIALLFCLVVSTLPEQFLSVIQILGGGYLVYLGITTLQIARSQNMNESNSSNEQGFWQTVGINLSNPNVYIFWGTIGAPIVLSGWGDSPLVGGAFIVGMYSMLVLVTAGTILLFGLTGKLPDNVRKWVLGALAIIVICFGVYQGITGGFDLLNP